jgi:hypothetical protein
MGKFINIAWLVLFCLGGLYLSVEMWLYKPNKDDPKDDN